jgi:hypothetical protein
MSHEVIKGGLGNRGTYIAFKYKIVVTSREGIRTYGIMMGENQAEIIQDSTEPIWVKIYESKRVSYLAIAITGIWQVYVLDTQANKFRRCYASINFKNMLCTNDFGDEDVTIVNTGTEKVRVVKIPGKQMSWVCVDSGDSTGVLLKSEKLDKYMCLSTGRVRKRTDERTYNGWRAGDETMQYVMKGMSNELFLLQYDERMSKA